LTPVWIPDQAHDAELYENVEVEAVYLAADTTFEDVTADLPRLIDMVYNETPTRS
jgi:hypothetical protein